MRGKRRLRGGGRGGPPIVDLLLPLGEYRAVDAWGVQLVGVGRIARTQGWSIGLTPQIIR